MEITKEMLDARESQILADLNALHGALQDVAYWRAKLDEPAAPALADLVHDVLGPTAEVLAVVPEVAP